MTSLCLQQENLFVLPSGTETNRHYCAVPCMYFQQSAVKLPLIMVVSDGKIGLDWQMIFIRHDGQGYVGSP